MNSQGLKLMCWKQHEDLSESDKDALMARLLGHLRAAGFVGSVRSVTSEVTTGTQASKAHGCTWKARVDLNPQRSYRGTDYQC